MPIFAADETESGGKKHSRFHVRRFRADRLRPASVDQSAYCSVDETVEAGVPPAGTKREQPASALSGPSLQAE